jgi:CheY-like chemotaxis protein
MAKARILVVENEGIVAKDLKERLNSLGYNVVGRASSGKEAIAKTTATRPDLILMDIKIMGPMNGIATAQKIKQCFNLPVVYLTAYADEDTVRRAKTTTPFGYPLKPFEDRELHPTIEIALYNHRMEQKLIESEKKYHTLARMSPVGIFHTDAKGYFVYVNQLTDEQLTASLKEKKCF